MEEEKQPSKKVLKVKSKKNNINVDIENQNQIIKKESGVYHDEHGKLLYEPDEEFKSCCFSIDKECAYYVVKMTISLCVLAFSFLMSSIIFFVFITFLPLFLFYRNSSCV